MNRQAPRLPMRTCISCRSRRPKSEVLRIVRGPDGLCEDPAQRLPGRGAYLCPDPRCVDAARRRNAGALRRALKGGDETEANGVLSAVAARLGEHQAPKGP